MNSRQSGYTEKQLKAIKRGYETTKAIGVLLVIAGGLGGVLYFLLEIDYLKYTGLIAFVVEIPTGVLYIVGAENIKNYRNNFQKARRWTDALFVLSIVLLVLSLISVFISRSSGWALVVYGIAAFYIYQTAKVFDQGGSIDSTITQKNDEGGTQNTVDGKRGGSSITVRIAQVLGWSFVVFFGGLILLAAIVGFTS